MFYSLVYLLTWPIRKYQQFKLNEYLDEQDKEHFNKEIDK